MRRGLKAAKTAFDRHQDHRPRRRGATELHEGRADHRGAATGARSAAVVNTVSTTTNRWPQFLQELGLPRPDRDLGVDRPAMPCRPQDHDRVPGHLSAERPSWSGRRRSQRWCVAGGGQAVIPIAHVERLRSLVAMPEEINRIVTTDCRSAAHAVTRRGVSLLPEGRRRRRFISSATR